MHGLPVPVVPDLSAEELAKRAVELTVAKVSGPAGQVVVRPAWCRAMPHDAAGHVTGC
jgi:hypothetical protein